MGWSNIQSGIFCLLLILDCKAINGLISHVVYPHFINRVEVVGFSVLKWLVGGHYHLAFMGRVGESKIIDGSCLLKENKKNNILSKLKVHLSSILPIVQKSV